MIERSYRSLRFLNILRPGIWAAFAFALAVIVAAGLQFAHVLTAQATVLDAGYRDFSYGGTTAPTGQKPQSKLWFNDGIWWGSMFKSSVGDFHIYRFNWSTNVWSDTGTLIDDRSSSSADCLWDGTHLYIASAGPTTDSTDSVRFFRYSYNSTTKIYTLDTGFPVTVVNGGMEAVVLTRDSTGKFWITFTRDDQVYVTHSLLTDLAWTTPFVPPVTGVNVDPDDISGIVSFENKVGVLWSNQAENAMYWATHNDGNPDNVWSNTRTVIGGPAYADDHFNLKSLQADPSGRVLAVTKTSLNDGSNPPPNSPLIMLHVLDTNDNWGHYTFGRVVDNHTRPILLIDTENRNLYIFASSPCCSGAVIYYKQSSLDNISFPTGLGTPFIQNSVDLNINNPTSTKQNLNSATGLLVEASDDHTHYYVHNVINLGPTGPTATRTRTRTSTPTATGTLPTSTRTFTHTRTPTLTPTATPTLQVLTFAPEADAYVDQAQPSTNFGTDSTLSVDSGTGNNQESFLRFTVSGVTNEILSAKVRLYASNGSVDGPEIYATSNNWSESDINWENRPSTTGTPTDDLGVVTSGAYSEYSVTPLVSGNGTFSFALLPTSTDGMDMNSRENIFPPELVLTLGSNALNTPTPTLTVTPTATATGTNSPTHTATTVPTDTPTNTSTYTLTTTPLPSDTPTSTLTNTPSDTPLAPSTPTITPSVIAVVGHVIFQGRGAPPNPRWSIPVVGSLARVGGGSLDFSATADQSGYFTLTTNLPTGMYSWRVKSAQTLANGDTGSFFSSVNLVEMGILMAGDADDNNCITSTDFNVLRPAFGRSMGQPGYDARAEFTGDNIVNSTDFNLLRASFGLCGAGLITSPTPTFTRTSTATPVPTDEATSTITSTPTNTVIPTLTETPEYTPTESATSATTDTSTPTNTPTETPIPTATNTPTPGFMPVGDLSRELNCDEYIDSIRILCVCSLSALAPRYTVIS